MAEIQEVFEDFGDNFKANIKKPWFKWALVGVVAVGLFVAYRKHQEGGTSAGGEYYTPTGYAGYPSVSGGGGDVGGSDSYDGLDTTQYDEFYAYLNSLQTSQDTSNDALSSQISALTDKLAEVQDSNKYLQEQLNQQMIISEMKNNSELRNITSSRSEKDSLHQRNIELAEQLGAVFDSDAGKYISPSGGYFYEPVSSLSPYQAIANKTPSVSSPSDIQAKINKALINGASASTINQLYEARETKLAQSGNTDYISYDKNTDYSTLIQQAQKLGASDSVIRSLEQQRDAKIIGEKMTQYYGAVGTTVTGSRSSGRVSQDIKKSSKPSKTRTTAAKRVTTTAKSTTKTAASSSSSDAERMQKNGQLGQPKPAWVTQLEKKSASKRKN